MKKIALIIIVTFSSLGLKAQTNLDSLLFLWEDTSQTDSIRTEAFKTYIRDGFLFSNADTAIILAESLLRFGENQNYGRATAIAYLLKGGSNYLKSDYALALKEYKRSFDIYSEIRDQKGSANCLNNIGNIYKAQGDFPEALNYYQHSLKIQEEIGDKSGSANAIGNIGRVYSDQGAYSKALEYFLLSLEIKEGTEDKRGIANALGNVGIVYTDLGEYELALDYLNRCLKLEEEIVDKRGSATSISSMGMIYSSQGKHSKALDYFQRSLNIYEETGDRKGRATSLVSIGGIYREIGDHTKALDFCKRALANGQEIGALNQAKAACQCLYDSYKSLGMGNEALDYLEKLNVIGDSLNAKETAKRLQQMEFAKQVLADSLASAEASRLAEEVHREEVRQKDQTRNILTGGSLFLFLIAVGIYSRLRYTRKAKGIIEKEKDRSENLLLNILPADIAAELKEKGRADARDFDSVSILFTDFKGFTEASEKLSAQKLVAEINYCFEAFDGIMARYTIEKIKTIGDAYMAAGGLPVPAENSTKSTVLAALEMQAFVSKRKIEMDKNSLPAFEMRAGIHTGPVVAGIVGVKKFQYDIWGDTVNTASRMESNGEVGRVNISQTTYELLKDEPDLSFENRGIFKVKGKGEMQMYFVKLKSKNDGITVQNSSLRKI